MALDLNKKTSSATYYYSDENSNTVGPFTLEQLLTKINKNTLVYREGIDWMNADQVEELKIYFKSQSNTAYTSLNEQSSTSVNTKKYFKAPFSFDGRIRRMEYGISFILYLFIYSSIFTSLRNNSFASLLYIPLIWFILAQGAKRCHDRGNSGWYQIIPFYILWMIFAEGDFNENEYGQSPK